MPNEPATIAAVWSAARAQLENDPDVTPRQRGYVRLVAPLAHIDDTVFLKVSDEPIRSFIETNLRADLVGALAGVLGYEPKLAISVDPDLKIDDADAEQLAGDVAASVHAAAERLSSRDAKIVR